MSFSLLLRSALALLLVCGVALLTVTHAGIPPVSALSLITGDQQHPGVVLPPPSSVSSAPPAPSHTHVSGASGAASAPKTGTHTPHAVVLTSGPDYAAFPDVHGYIFYTTPDHNLSFITRRHFPRQITGDGASVAPALSPDSSQLAWVIFKRNYSDLVVTHLRFGRDGSVAAMPATMLTQDQTPPPALQRVPNYVWDPRFDWWANKPSWLPDGQHLLYLSDRPGFDPSDLSNVGMAVWAQDVTDTITDAVQLTTPQAGTGGADSPAWRPHDASTFLYVNYGVNGSQTDGVIEAATAPTLVGPMAYPTGGNGIATNITDLTPQGLTEFAPAWSPDGKFIAFVQNGAHGTSNLLVMPFHPPGSLADYHHAITVAAGNPDSPYVAQPFWSPDGSYLGYLVADGTGAFHLVIRPVAHIGGHLRFGRPIAIPQAGPVSADYRPTWGQ